MATPQPAQSVVQHGRGSTETLWFACRASKAQCPADVDKWQARCRGSARRHGDAKSCWVQQCIRSKGQVDLVKAEPNGVGARGAKQLVITQSRQVPEAIAGISESRKIRIDRPSSRRLLSGML